MYAEANAHIAKYNEPNTKSSLRIGDISPQNTLLSNGV